MNTPIKRWLRRWVRGREQTGANADYVFVSYARDDRPLVDKSLLEPLKAATIPYWIDDHIEWDASWWTEVREHLRASHAVVVAMTTGAQESKWVSHELTVAEEIKKPLFPVLISGDGLPELSAVQHLDLRHDSSVPGSWLRQLRDRLRRGRFARMAKHAIRQTLIVYLPIIAMFIGFAQLIVPLVTDHETPLPTFTRDYGIGVAEFTVEGEEVIRENLEAEVTSFQPRLVNGIADALGGADTTASSPTIISSVRIEVQPISRSFQGDHSSEVDGWALDLATRTGADVLVYGRIEIAGARLIARPELFLDGSKLPRAEELAGRYELRTIDHDITEPAGAAQLRSEIAGLGRELASFVEIIRLYDNEQFEQALTNAQEMAAVSGFLDTGLLDIIQGNLQGKLGRSSDALTSYTRALNDPRVESRARLGLAQVQYSTLLGPDGHCDADTDVGAMLGVVTMYQELASVASAPGANIPTKAIFGAGRALLCLEAAGLVPDSGQSRANLSLVVDTYDAQGANHDGDLRELAAESEALIGFADARSAGDAVSRSRALDHIDRALELTTFTDRQVAFRITKADAHIVWGDRDAACAEIEAAARLSSPDEGDDLRAKYGCSAQ